MKAFAFVLLCALAAVQGRYHGLQSTRSAAALGENPWVVHLRIATSTSGLLETCVGSLIDNRWVLTTASCVSDARFIWVRYGAVNVINPSLVTENSLVRVLDSADLALIDINRNVETTDNIAPAPPTGKVSNAGTFCGYGGDDAPGEVLNCFEVSVDTAEDGSLVVSSDEVQASKYDIGAPLVANGEQFAILVGEGSEGSPGKFLATAPYKGWIEQETGINFGSDDAPEAVSFVQ